MSWILDLGLAGLVFLGLCVWLVRRVAKAAGTERDLEGERLQGALAEELLAAHARAEQEAPEPAPPEPAPAPAADPLSGADLTLADPAHLPLVAEVVAEREQSTRAQHNGATDVHRRVEVLWVRSTATHAVWCERRHAATRAAAAMTRDVICVALIERSRLTERWTFG